MMHHSYLPVCLLCVYACSVTQLCLTLCNPIPVSSVHGIIQARILEWVAISFSWGSSQPRDRTMSLLYWQVGSLSLCYLGSPCLSHVCLIFIYVTHRRTLQNYLLNVECTAS